MRNIIIDSREQRPFGFAGAITKKLDAGDYSLEGLEHRIAIERKSADDFVNTILRASKRFKLELAKLQQMDFAMVVIESTPDAIEQHDYTSDAHPNSIFGLMISLQLEFHPVHFYFAGNRPQAQNYIGRLFSALDKHYSELDSMAELAELAGAQHGNN